MGTQFSRTDVLLSRGRQLGGAVGHLMSSSRFAAAVLFSILALESLALSLTASRRPFWYDELLTLHVASITPISSLIAALQAGVDGMPLVYYVFVQTANLLPLNEHVTLRLPSVLGYILALTGVFLFAQRRLPGAAALIPVFLLTLSQLREAAVDARSYALLVGFLSMAAAFWQRIDASRMMAPLFAISLGLAVSCHYMAVVAISCFGIAEVVATIAARRIRWRVWISCVLAATPFLISLPLILRFKALYGKNFWARPSWSALFTTYGAYMSVDYKLVLVYVVVIGLLVAVVLWQLLGRQWKPAEGQYTLAEGALVVAFLMYPAMLVIATKIQSSGYTARYGWPAVLGIALGCAYLARATWLDSLTAPLFTAFVLIFGFQMALDFKTAFGTDAAGSDQRWAGLERLSVDHPGLPVVVGSGHTFLEAAKYAPQRLRGRLLRIVDPENSVRFSGADSNDKITQLLARYVPLPVENLDTFRNAHQKFILCSGSRQNDWLTPFLLQNGYHLKLLSANSDSLYIAERGLANE